MKEAENNWLLIKHKDEYAVNKKYNSEAFAKKPAPKKKTAGKAIKKKK